MAAKEKLQSYVVTTRGLHIGKQRKRREIPIGETIKLTEKQARSRKGKVVLESEYGRAKASDVQMRDAQATIENHLATIEKRDVKIAEQADVIEKLEAQLTAPTEGDGS